MGDAHPRIGAPGAAPCPRLALVHLVRAANGPEPFLRFLDSYRANDAGVPHRLVLILKGFASPSEYAPYRSLLGGLPHEVLEVDDAGFDVTPYLYAASRLDFDCFCFLNSFSVIEDTGWLEKMHSLAALPGVGLVGATGSWESYLTNFAPSVAPPHRFLMHVGGSWVSRRRQAGIRAYLGRRRELRRISAAFPPFPNPHVRSNAFMLRRDVLLRLRTTPIVSKLDALVFESGRMGMTRQVWGMGLQTLVVGRDGRGYLPEEWPRSRTFRGGEHENLLVSDNRTREYLALAPEERAAGRRRTWGAD